MLVFYSCCESNQRTSAGSHPSVLWLQVYQRRRISLTSPTIYHK
ncbi:hypothetical protein LINPERHAP1_LOCUS17605 [Linum perenne]